MKYSRQWMHIALFEALVLLFFSAITARDIWAEETPKELIIGYQAVLNPQTVVKELGWHEKELGIPIKWIKYDSGRHVNKALASGSVDIGLVGSSPCAAGISQGIDIEVIWIHDVIGDSESLAVKADSGIKNVKDLVGKRVAVDMIGRDFLRLMRPDKIYIYIPLSSIASITNLR